MKAIRDVLDDLEAGCAAIQSGIERIRTEIEGALEDEDAELDVLSILAMNQLVATMEAGLAVVTGGKQLAETFLADEGEDGDGEEEVQG